MAAPIMMLLIRRVGRLASSWAYKRARSLVTINCTTVSIFHSQKLLMLYTNTLATTQKIFTLFALAEFGKYEIWKL